MMLKERVTLLEHVLSFKMTLVCLTTAASIVYLLGSRGMDRYLGEINDRSDLPDGSPLDGSLLCARIWMHVTEKQLLLGSFQLSPVV